MSTLDLFAVAVVTVPAAMWLLSRGIRAAGQAAAEKAGQLSPMIGRSVVLSLSRGKSGAFDLSGIVRSADTKIVRLEVAEGDVRPIPIGQIRQIDGKGTW